MARDNHIRRPQDMLARFKPRLTRDDRILLLAATVLPLVVRRLQRRAHPHTSKGKSH